MKLSTALLPAYAELVDTPLQQLIARHEAGQLPLANIRVQVHEGRLVAALGIRAQGESGVMLRPVAVDGWSIDQLCPLIAEATQRLRALGCRHAAHRSLRAQTTPSWQAGLMAAGWQAQGDRIEFTAEVQRLPSDLDSPLGWKTLDAVGLPVAAQALYDCAWGDPSFEPDDDPVEAIEAWLSDPVLTHDERCIQVGFLDDRVVAFVAAQINPQSGWSRISYMGVRPEHRRSGLGRWVHRRGFEMMKEQGGARYHGGTTSENAPMLALFRSHGAVEKAHLKCWSWRARSQRAPGSSP